MPMEEYPSDSDFRVFVEEKLGRDRMQKFLKRNKNFLVHTNQTSAIADVSRRILFGLDEADHLKEGVLRDQDDKEKSTAFTFKSEASTEELEADLARRSSSEETFNENKNIKVRGTTQLDEGFEVGIEYVHTRATRRTMMDSDDKATSIQIEETGEEDVYKVSQDYRKYDEFNAVKDFFEGWNSRRVADNQESIEMGDIILDRLRLEERVNFFNDILSENPGPWRFEDTRQLGIRQGEQMEEMFEDAEDEDDIRNELDENLRGITEAVLSGEGLRTNEFVQTCIDNGYYFDAGRLLFVNTDVAKQVEVLIEFKQPPKGTFDVTIEEEYETLEDGSREPVTFDSEYRTEIRDLFRDLLIDLYGDYVDMPDLIEEKHGPDELTDLDNVGEDTAQNLEDNGLESVEDVLNADREELIEVEGIGEKTADNILN